MLTLAIVLSAPVLAEEPVEARWFGKWVSESCGERTYPRILDVDKLGSWRIEDRVAPCPPDAMCIWSGIVTSKGTWDATASELKLKETEPGGTQSTPRPTVLKRTKDGVTSEEKGATCTYKRPS